MTVLQPQHKARRKTSTNHPTSILQLVKEENQHKSSYIHSPTCQGGKPAQKIVHPFSNLSRSKTSTNHPTSILQLVGAYCKSTRTPAVCKKLLAFEALFRSIGLLFFLLTFGVRVLVTRPGRDTGQAREPWHAS